MIWEIIRERTTVSTEAQQFCYVFHGFFPHGTAFNRGHEYESGTFKKQVLRMITEVHT